jgi:hypothetical protein
MHAMIIRRSTYVVSQGLPACSRYSYLRVQSTDTAIPFKAIIFFRSTCALSLVCNGQYNGGLASTSSSLDPRKRMQQTDQQQVVMASMHATAAAGL